MGGSTSTLVDTTEFPADLKCLNCGELLTVLPIYFYINKGNVCGRCPQILDADSYQNKALEAMITLQKLPCRYKKNGCTYVFDYKTVKKHELICYYRQYSCPTIPLQCVWKGRRSEMKEHYDEKHKYALMTPDKYIVCSLNTEYEQNILIESIYKQFLFHTRYDKKILHCGLIYFEEPSVNKKYIFTLVLKNGEKEYKEPISNTRFLDTYLISNNELHEINFDRIDLLVNNSKSVSFYIDVSEVTC